MMRQLSPCIFAALVLIGLCALPGCTRNHPSGYSMKPIHDTSISTVAVPIFENETFDRGVEFELTDALIKEIVVRTPYKVTSESGADSILIGRITDVQRTLISQSRNTRLAEEVIYSVTIDFEWRDQRTGEPLVIRRQFTGSGLFVPSDPTGESIDIGQFAAVQQLARDLVEELQAAW